MVKVIRKVLRRPAAARDPRHRIGHYVPVVRTHPWFELRAQRTAELGQYR
ncbi:hypothetical protein BH09ACT4_BH09ACT4_22960 [soil metagenome]